MERNVLMLMIFALAIAAVAEAQITKPVTYTWMVTSCETWNCAAAELVRAGGDKNVIILPTSRQDRPWLVLRRIEEGAIVLPENEPFTCEVFGSVTDASSRFTAMDSCHAPLILNVPDGKALVASLSKCDDAAGRRRAVTPR